MFFEASYLPSPQFSSTSQDDSTIPESLSPTEDTLPPPQVDSSSEETTVNHLVFVIHGIGQQTEQYGHFYEHVESLQETTRQVLQAKVPDHNVRIELIPIEWHRHIHDQVDPILNRITLKSIPTIRLIENDYLADVLFYFSKDRGQSIIDNVTHLFNTSYHNFMEKHPDFNGKIVILGYSLGGILTWDILSHQRQPNSKEEEQDYRKLDVIYGKLDFKPNYFFTLGSPIGAVLTFRNQSPVTYHPDHGIIFENVFHPFDPLAYRIEPLYDDYYIDQPAVLVERSVPFGPSFSFPSLPSLPGLNLFSYFSWKMSSSSSNTNNDNMTSEMSTMEATSIECNSTNAPENDNHLFKNKHLSAPCLRSSDFVSDTIEDLQHRDLGDESGKGSIMNSLLQYFGKGQRGSKDSILDMMAGYKTNSTTSPSNAATTCDIGEQDRTLLVEENAQGIITWDPLQEQRRAVISTDKGVQKPALWDSLIAHTNENGNNKSGNNDNDHKTNDDDDDRNNRINDHSLMSASSSSSTNYSGRRQPLQRAKTYCAQGTINDTTESMLFYEFGKGMTTTGRYKQENNTTDYTNEMNNSDNNTTTVSPSTKLRHLVEVLGIDGVRMESFERAKTNFQRNSNKSSVPQQPQDHQESKRSTNNNSNENRVDGFEDVSSVAEQVKDGVHEDVTTFNTISVDTTNDRSSTNIETDKDVQEQDEEKEDQSKSDKGSNEQQQQQEEARAQEALKHLPGNRRMDFALQPDGFMSMIANEYIVGLRAHFSYWTSKDLMWHILQTLEK